VGRLAGLGALFLALPLLAAEPSASAVGLRLEVESLSLAFEAPTKWRLSRESKPEQLVLYPGKSKTEPVLRVRAFQGRLSPKDRLLEMTRGLSEEEAKVRVVSSEAWVHERLRYETAVLIYERGAQAWHGSFTLVDQPRNLQHGFWLFGRERDVERHAEAVRQSVISARSLGAAVEGDGPDGEPTEEEPAPREAIWADRGSGLRVLAWPAAFSPERETLDELAKGGLRLVTDDERAHGETAFLLRLERGAKPGSAQHAAASLHTELAEAAGVEDLRRIPVRVAGQEAALIKWTENRTSARLLHEVRFFQKGGDAFRIDYTAEEAWARTRSRRSLVKDFIAGIDFE